MMTVHIFHVLSILENDFESINFYFVPDKKHLENQALFQHIVFFAWLCSYTLLAFDFLGTSVPLKVNIEPLRSWDMI